MPKLLSFDELFEKIRKDEEERVVRQLAMHKVFVTGLDSIVDRDKICRMLMRMHAPTVGQQ